MSAVMDPRGFKVWPIGAPRDVDRERHYLYRFWERLPPAGAISVFDRSWYGRVLVERVEGFAGKAEWSRAYGEINEFEHMLVDDGTRIVKLFLHIAPEVQLKRFEQRLNDPLKRITSTLAEGVDLEPRPMDEEAKAMARAVFGRLPKDL